MFLITGEVVASGQPLRVPGALVAGTVTGRAAGFTVRQARRATHAEGAGASGLSRVIELHAFNGAGDATTAGGPSDPPWRCGNSCAGCSRTPYARSLRYAFVVFVAATVLAILLPARVDRSAGEERPSISHLGVQRKRRPQLPRTVGIALRANTGMRLLSGFLTMFMAFLLRNEPFPGWEDRPELLLGLVIGSAGLGSTIGIALGSMLRRISPSVTAAV